MNCMAQQWPRTVHHRHPPHSNEQRLGRTLLSDVPFCAHIDKRILSFHQEVSSESVLSLPFATTSDRRTCRLRIQWPPSRYRSLGSDKANSCLQTLRSVPKRWIIAAVLFYCISVVGVGLLVGFVFKRTDHVNVVVSPSPVSSTSPRTLSTSTRATTTGRPVVSTTTTTDAAGCIGDECNPRLSTDLVVHNYKLEYLYNGTQQTSAEGLVTIRFTLKQPTQQLIYHSKRMLRLEQPALFENDVYRLVTMRTYPANDYISLRLANNLPFAANQYSLVQKFAVSLTDGNTGFYQTVFRDGNVVDE